MTIVKKKTRKKTGDASKPNISNAQRQTGLRPARPDAFKIKTSGETSYADIIRKVKNAPDLKVLGERVTRIRCTQAGELLLELGRPGVPSQELQAITSSTLQGTAEVLTLTHKEVLIIKDMDESTSAEEVAQAITVATSTKVTPECVILRKSYSGTQEASVLLPIAEAKKLLQSGKLRIGWVN